MAEVSYPVLGSAMGEAQWRVMARAWGSGIVDSGSSPYRIVSVNDTTNQLIIGRDTVTGSSEAIVNGFVHRIDTDVAVTVPTSAATYEVGIVYDPAGHGTAAGPLTLQCWVAPGDFTNGKMRQPLYRITRAAAQALSVAPRTSLKVWAHPSIMVANSNDLPSRPQDYPWGTEALCYLDGKRFRANTTEWTEIPTTDPAVTNASGAIVPNVLVKRGTDGGFLVPEAVHSDHPVPRWQFLAHSHSWSSITGKPSTFAPSSHTHSGSAITSGVVDWERISGSTYAYDQTSGGSTWATVAVSSGGKFFRYPSALKYKTNIRPWKPDVRAGFGIETIIYDRKDEVDPETGETIVGLKDYIGVPADDYVDTFPNLVEFGPDGDVEGWHYELWTVLHQAMLRDLDERVERLVGDVKRENGELRQIIAGLSDRLAALEGK